jgi:tRNA A-37 threonylcarbamoyl transferase component Bud32
MSPSASLLSGVLAERYVIEGEIGRGGTAIVYRARDRQRGIAVAVKVMREDLITTVSLERFMLEIRRTMTLQHPHIVPVLDSGQHQGMPYSVLPFMDGGTLRERLLRDKQLPLEEVVALGVTIARALDFAHQRGVVHRDVKPENILYTNGQPCLSDFGTARAFEGSMNDPTTSTGVVRGTAAYMSPEQASGERELDGRSDVYSLACVLYECIAGVQPFVGPSAQAVISQRLSHVPRPVSVYRPTVSEELEQALVRATSTLPADRHGSAGELAAALERSPASGPRRVTPESIRIRSTRARRSLAIATTAVAVVAVGLLAKQSGWRSFAPTAQVDTTRVVVFPFEVRGDSLPYQGEDLLYEGFRHWRGLTLNETYETKDAIRQAGRGTADLRSTVASLSVEDAARIARSLGAGRFIRGHLVNNLQRPRAYAAIYDASSKKSLYEASLELTGPPLNIFETFASLADSLVLRARGVSPPPVPHERVNNVASMQAFLRARVELDEWNLGAADSLFTLSAQLDTANLRAGFWRTQVRSWRGKRPTEWGTLPEFKRGDTTSLSTLERRLASALSALQNGDYSRSCAVYQSVVDQHPQDFAGWYGLGECRRLDRLVVPDSNSPTKWAFRSGRESAIRAYARALEVLPSVYRAVEGGGLDVIRERLFTDPLVVLAGRSADGSAFLARMGSRADTVIFIPYPTADFQRTIPDTTGEIAAARNRTRFSRIASGWAVAMPQSAGAKQTQAVALEMLGDAAAADSFSAARRVSRDLRQARKLGAYEAIARIKLAISNETTALPSALALVDSVLSVGPAASPEEAELMVRLAALTGRCSSAARFSSVTLPGGPWAELVIPPSLNTDILASTAMVGSGCVEVELPDVKGELRRYGLKSPDASGREAGILSLLAALRFPMEPERVVAYAALQPNNLVKAQAFLIKGQRDSAHTLLARMLPIRKMAAPGTLMPDASLVEARIWLQLGDTSRAAWLLDRTLHELRYQQPVLPSLASAPRFGSIAQAALLRASIASDEATRRKWRDVVSLLWRSADPPVKSRLR